MKPYYQDDTTTIYHGDSREILKDIDGGVVISDPPYGVGLKYGDSYKDRPKGYWEWFELALAEMRRDNRLVAFTHRQAALKNLAPEWDWIAVWHKPLTFAGLMAYPVMPKWEPILIYNLQGRKLARGFDHFSVVPVNSVKSDHPAPKPLGLYLHLVNWLTTPDDTVIDPYMGSGTTIRAAKNAGRRSIGIEIEERYCEMAANRLAQEVLAI